MASNIRASALLPLLPLLLDLSGCQQARHREATPTNARCGDGLLTEPEICDDGNLTVGDGCNETCRPEPGWQCMPGGISASCVPVCGDGLRVGPEACDDGSTAGRDGCTNECVVRIGWTCDDGSPSRCAPTCGDGRRTGEEQCDDGNRTSEDGCDTSCREEPGFRCDEASGMCAAICGDGRRVGAETCDDGNVRGGDGCSPSCVRIDAWRSIQLSAESKLPPYGAAVWAGSEIFLWWGTGWNPRGFNPTEGLWRNIPDLGPDVMPGGGLVISTGEEVFVLGARDDATRAGMYNPRTNRWRAVSSDGLPPASLAMTGVWTGSQILVWGGDGDMTDGALYDLASDHWQPMTREGAPPVRQVDGLKSFWWAGELIVFSYAFNEPLIVAGYSPALDRWRTLSSEGGPTSARETVVADAPDEIFVITEVSLGVLVASAYDFHADAWRSLPPPPIGSAHFAAWAGSELVVVGAAV